MILKFGNKIRIILIFIYCFGFLLLFEVVKTRSIFGESLIRKEPFFAFKVSNTIKLFPNIPDKCFDGKLFCIKTDIVENMVGKNRGFRIEIFALVPHIETQKELEEVFLDFNKWPEYAARSDEVNLKYLKSERLPDFDQDGKTVFRQYSHYNAKWPFGYMEVRALTHLWFVEPIVGACRSLEFENINIENPQEIFEIKDFPGTTGIKYRKGSVHVRAEKFEDDFSFGENFVVFYTSDILLSVNILEQVALSFVEKAHVDILRGLLDI